jgi:hypothetical protein
MEDQTLSPPQFLSSSRVVQVVVGPVVLVAILASQGRGPAQVEALVVLCLSSLAPFFFLSFLVYQHQRLVRVFSVVAVVAVVVTVSLLAVLRVVALGVVAWELISWGQLGRQLVRLLQAVKVCSRFVMLTPYRLFGVGPEDLSASC